MNTTFKLVTELADRVMGWYGFTHESDYRLLPNATTVAVELTNRGITPDTLTRWDIESADEYTSAGLMAMWEACRVPHNLQAVIA